MNRVDELLDCMVAAQKEAMPNTPASQLLPILRRALWGLVEIGEVSIESPIDCSGDPNDCPENEGCGCFCTQQEGGEDE